jgi:hypothetical protein
MSRESGMTSSEAAHVERVRHDGTRSLGHIRSSMCWADSRSAQARPAGRHRACLDDVLVGLCWPRQCVCVDDSIVRSQFPHIRLHHNRRSGLSSDTVLEPSNHCVRNNGERESLANAQKLEFTLTPPRPARAAQSDLAVRREARDKAQVRDAKGLREHPWRMTSF